MSTLIKTIKSHLTDDTIYPVTKADAVYLANSTAETVESHLANLETIVGENSISNINNTITGAIGNNTLTTTAQTLSGAINELNTIATNVGTYIDSSSQITQVPSGSTTLTDGASIALPKGDYLIFSIALFAANSNGFRLLSPSSQSEVITTNLFVTSQAITESGQRTTLTMTRVMRVQEDGGVIVRNVLRQNSGSTLSTTNRVIAYRLK